MPDHDAEMERKMRALGQRAQRGWERIYRATESDLKVVREVVRQEWEQQRPNRPPGEARKAQVARGTKRQKSGPSQEQGSAKKSRRQSRGRRQ
jgi:hypothetical protein